MQPQNPNEAVVMHHINESPINTGLLQGALVGLLVGIVIVTLYLLRLETASQFRIPPAGDSLLEFESDPFTQGVMEGKAAAWNRRLELGLDQ